MTFHKHQFDLFHLFSYDILHAIKTMCDSCYRRSACVCLLLHTWNASSRVCFNLLLCFLDDRLAREHSNDDRTDGSVRLKTKSSVLCFTGPAMHVSVYMYRMVRAIHVATYVNVFARLYEYVQQYHNSIKLLF